MPSPKTREIVFLDGSIGRGANLTIKNYGAMLRWTGGEAIFEMDKDGNYINHKIKLYHNGTKLRRVAIPGDLIIKTYKGFTVVKSADILKKLKVA